MRRIGVADDGAAIEVVVSTRENDVLDESLERDVDGLLTDCWPSLGLRPGETEVGAARTIEVTVSGDGVLPLVRVGGVPLRAGRGWHAVESELALFAAERVRGFVAVHAAVLAEGDEVVVLPGRSRSGKSTLCAAALEAGWRVWGDEYALVDAEGGVTAWPRSLHLRADDGVRRVPLAEQPPVSPTTPTAVVSMPFDPDCAMPVLAGWDRLDAMVHTLMNTVCAASRPIESFRAVSALTDGPRLLRGTRGEAAAALELLGDTLRTAG